MHLKNFLPIRLMMILQKKKRLSLLKTTIMFALSWCSHINTNEDKLTKDQIIQQSAWTNVKHLSKRFNATKWNCCWWRFLLLQLKNDKKFIKINCTANFSPTKQPFHELLTLKRKLEHIENVTWIKIKKTELSKHSFDKKSELAV